MKGSYIWLLIFAICAGRSCAHAQDSPCSVTGPQVSCVNGTPVPDRSRVEPLTPTEVKALADAEAELKAAQAKHDAEVEKIKAAHGETICTAWNASSAYDNVVCVGDETVVEFWGSFALIKVVHHPNPLLVNNQGIK